MGFNSGFKGLIYQTITAARGSRLLWPGSMYSHTLEATCDWLGGD